MPLEAPFAASFRHHWKHRCIDVQAPFAATVRYRRWGCAVLALLVRRWFTGACVGVPLVHWCAAGPLVHWWAAGALVGHWYAVGFPKINK